MTVEQFIIWLQSLNVPYAEVHAWDPDAQTSMPVTGAVYDQQNLELHTDVANDLGVAADRTRDPR